MADFADASQAQVDAFLAVALAMAHARPGPAAEIVNGVPCCAECGEPAAKVAEPSQGAVQES